MSSKFVDSDEVQVVPYSPSPPPRLTIRAIETVPIRVALPRVFEGSFYRMTHRTTLLIRILTEEGLVGEAYVGDEDKTIHEIDRAIHDEIKPRLIGRDGTRIQQCWTIAEPVTYDILRDRRIGLVALAAVDTALWDLFGKCVDLPLWRVWGGFRDRLPLMAIGGYYGEPLGTIDQEVSFYKELGLAGMKFKVGGLSAEEDARRVWAARKTAGEDFILTIDANQGYELSEALRLCQMLEGAGIRWFEEPVRWGNDHRSLRDVRMRGGIPVCAGQSELAPAGCRDLMEQGSIDVCNFDASWSGGPTAWLRVAAVAQTYDVMMGHHEEPHVASHLLASQPHGTFAECFHPDRDPFWWHLITHEGDVKDGLLTLPAAPGLGWRIDSDYVNHHRVDR